MPIMAAHGQNDARGTARLLAITALDCIRNPEAGGARAVALNNVYRLLEAYRVNSFFGLEAPTKHFPPRATEVISLLPRPERHVREVRTAIERAITDVYAGQSKEQAIKAVEDVLRRIAYPNDFTRPSEDDRRKADRFFEEVVRQLHVG